MDLLVFAEKVRMLKSVKRTGWALKGVKEPDSVAGHSFSLALLAFVYSRKFGLDADKAVRLALVHDLCEVYTGDITTRLDEKDQAFSNSEKRQKETDALEKLAALLPGDMRGEIKALWQEFEARSTREAKLVKDLDRLEMSLEALHHARMGEGNLQEFFDVAARDIRTPEIRKIFLKIYEEFKALAEKKRERI